VPATLKGKRVLVVLKPEGFLQSGAPNYPSFEDAVNVPVSLAANEIETAVDRFANVVCNADPEMLCFAPDGRKLWSYSNRWVGVHGSHNAPLPETGVMQGCLYFLGMAPLDERGDVFIMNGNHGRFFALTSDGLYLDEMFKDVRMGGSVDAYHIGGECFGGFFGRSEKDGNYYLQSGHTDYRIFRIHGLSEAKRASGSVTVTAEQVIAAANNQVRAVAATSERKEAVAPYGSKADSRDFEIRWDKGQGKFPVTAGVAWDEKNLYVHYQVRDTSPWVNNGKDWTTLFKTGDSVDLQLGTDPQANPARRGPVPGDLRLLIAPFQGGNVAVLYRHRVPGAKNPVAFNSPWRSEKVDVVERLDAVKIEVKKGTEDYRVDVAVPLSALGLKPPGAFRADLGVIYGDPGGAINMLRSYWSNQATGLMNDVPGEIMLHPNLWGTLTLKGAAK